MSNEQLRIEYIDVEQLALWERNAKRHDFGALWESIQRHGFKNPPKFEPTLNGGRGGIVAGNGRSHVLLEMKRANEPAPRGIVEQHGKWLAPILFGVDAESERAAEAYGVDDNNLTMLGGDVSAADLAKMWDEAGYAELLADLANHETLPVSVDGEDVDALIAQLAADGTTVPGVNSDSFEQTQRVVKGEKPTFGVLVICEGEGEQAEMFERLKEEGYNCVLQGTKPPGVKR